MKKIFLTGFAAFIMLLNMPASAENNYITESYTSHIRISESREYHYKTQLDLNFLALEEELSFSIANAGDSSTGKTDNILVENEKHKVHKKGSNVNISITDKQGFTGKRRIKIQYDKFLTRDKEKNYDFAYLTLVEGSTTPITNAYITVTLPTDQIDAIEITSTGTEKNWNYIKEGNTITVTASDINPSEKLYLTVKMPEGTFKNARLIIFNQPARFTLYITLFTLAVILYLAWLFVKFGLDKRIVYETEAYPPENFSPVETEYAYTRTISDKACASMVLLWATKGFLKIVQHTPSSYTLIKLKDISDDQPEFFKTAFNELFLLGDGDKVLSNELENNYYSHVERIKADARSAFIKEKVLDNSKSGKYSLRSMLLLILAGLFAILMTGIINKALFSGIFISAFLFSVASLVIYRFFRFAADKVYNNTQLLIIGSIISILSFLVAFILGNFTNSSDVLNMVFTVIILGVILSLQLAVALISRKTDYAARIMGQIKGFKHFLKNPKKDILNSVLEDNKNYFYDMLPYVILFGCAEKWGETFKNIDVLECNFYILEDKPHNPPNKICKRIAEFINLVSEKSFSYYRIKTNKDEKKSH